MAILPPSSSLTEYLSLDYLHPESSDSLTMSSRSAHHTLRQSYTSRAVLPGTHPLAQFLFHLMCMKKSNLCLSADVSSTAHLLQLAEEVGDSICMIKTHADIIDDFSERTVKGLRDLAREKKFLVFEDRKLGDIGSTSLLMT